MKTRVATPGHDVPPPALPASYYELSARIVRLADLREDIDAHDFPLIAKANAKLALLCQELQALIDEALGPLACPKCTADPALRRGPPRSFRVCVSHDLANLRTQVHSRPPLGLETRSVDP